MAEVEVFRVPAGGNVFEVIAVLPLTAWLSYQANDGHPDQLIRTAWWVAGGAVLAAIVTRVRDSRERVVLDAHGVTVVRFLRRTRRLAWAELTGIEVVENRFGRCLYVRTARQRLRLPAPVGSGDARDPDFGAEVARIIARWKEHRSTERTAPRR